MSHRKVKAIREEEILRKGTVSGNVTTPAGNMTLYTVVESRGFKTNYLPKSFQYVKLPGNVGIFPVTKAMEKYWRASGFTVKKDF